MTTAWRTACAPASDRPTPGVRATCSTGRIFIDRFKRLWWLKAIGTTAFMWVFFDIYFQLQRHPHFAVAQVPLTALDNAIPMQSWAWLPYISLWLYTSLPPAVLPGFRVLVYYGISIGAVCSVGLLCFYFWPTSVPPIRIPEGADFPWVRQIDTAANACPSLHVAGAFFSWAWLRHQLLEVRAGRGWHVFNVLWSAAIILSTLFTKQHIVWDVVGGLALGGAGSALSLLALRASGLKTLLAAATR